MVKSEYTLRVIHMQLFIIIELLTKTCLIINYLSKEAIAPWWRAFTE